MDVLQAIFLGALQGITEWLPISSQGQVIIGALSLLGTGAENAFRYAVFLHIGTLIAASVFFRRELAGIVMARDKPLLKFFITALLASAVTAAPIYFLFRGVFNSPAPLLALIGTALVFSGAIQFKRKLSKPREDMGHGFLTGLAQGLAVIPGISRSGVTVAALLFEDFEPEEAFRLSFLLSIPSVFLAEVAFALIEGAEFHPALVIAIATAAIVGYASIGFLIKIAKKINFSLFCIAFGIVYILLALI
jgi:undecaprenyl-diphosphatase